MRYSAAIDFRGQLEAGKALCVMPVPRLVLAEPISVEREYRFYPEAELDLAELRIVSHPKMEWERGKEQGVGDIAWMQSGATQIEPADYGQFALAAFPVAFNWPAFFDGTHDYHKALIREFAEQAESALDLLRFDYCQLDQPETLPGRAGTFGLGNPFSSILIYDPDEHASYIIGAEVFGHRLVAGMGLEIAGQHDIASIPRGEAGSIARRGLGLLSAAMEANTDTQKFILAMAILDYLAYPSEHLKAMKVAKLEIAAHVARTKEEYEKVKEDIYDLTGRKQDGRVIGLRTNIVHLGQRLEDLVPEPDDRTAIFRRLGRYIGKVLHDLIRLGAEPWAEVETYRQERKLALGVTSGE